MTTKQEFRKAIKEQNVQRLYQLTSKMLNRKAKFNEVYDVITSTGASNKSKNDAIYAIHESRHEIQRMRQSINHFDEFETKRNIIEFVKEQIGYGESNYTKVAMLGNRHLYFASKTYQHSDYNKWCTMLKIAGNEKFVNKVIEWTNRRFNCNFATI